jgi:hypothetical protein
MRDVPLANAVIAATLGRNGHAPEVRILRRYDPAITRYAFTAGAGEDRWDNHPDHRLGLLYETLWFLAHAFKIPADIIHAAMQAIPEYRDLEGNDLAA